MFTRDIPNGNFIYKVYPKASQASALCLGYSQSVAIEVLVPRYNKKDFGGQDSWVESRYVGVRGMGHFDMKATDIDAEKRGIVSVRIVPNGFPMTNERANAVFELIASA